MHCEEARELIADKLTGTLSAGAEARLREHLAGCAVCREELAQMEDIWSTLGWIPVPRMQSSGVRRTVLNAAEGSGVGFFGRKFTMREALRAAAVIVVVASLAAGAGLWLGRHRETDSDTIAGQVRGSADAPIALVEYGDYECPPCVSYQVTVRRLLEKYPDSLKYEYRHFPLIKIHPTALRAAAAAEAAGEQDKFWAMHDLLLNSQEKWRRIPDVEPVFMEFAESIGLNVDDFRSSLRSGIAEQRILKQVAQAREFGIESVPTFVINGRKVEQTPGSFEEFESLIIQELDSR